MTIKKQKSDSRHRDGSIKIIKGYIYARIQYIDETSGKRKEKVRRAQSRTDARKLIKEMRSELKNQGQDALETDKITFATLAERYSQTHLVAAIYQNGIKVAGKRSLMPSLSSLKPVVSHFGRKLIRMIRPSDIEAYKIMRLNTPVEILANVKIYDEIAKKSRVIKEIRQRPRKIASVNRELELMRAIFNFAKAEDLLTKTPFETSAKIISTSAEVERDRVMSMAEEKRLLEACSGRRLHIKPLIIVATDTAMRRNELFKLRWQEVNLQLREIKILASNAKTEKTRTVGLTNRSYAELSRIWEQSPKNSSDLVFGITSTIKNAWKSACIDAEIIDLRFHDLRHTATTRLIRSKVPASEVMKITGHTQTKTFLRYLNLTSESVSNSARCLDQYLLDTEDDSDKLHYVN